MARVLPMAPTAVPSLDELAANPEQAGTLPAHVLQGLACRCAVLQTAILAALVSLSGRTGGAADNEADSLIDVAGAAQRLGVSKDWLYHHAEQLPFTVRQGRLLRFSSHGINRYIRTRQNRHAA